ncbi:methyltransferase domain-containing protein [Helicobacter didelphidarum]|uniref:hypothetical protein n=1 Tax=Helicobacter didelphidarum TaxID=2040648 RepID=UPI001FE979BF|nr:hypothetical protein [Helicobacter didelphidarum]
MSNVVKRFLRAKDTYLHNTPIQSLMRTELVNILESYLQSMPHDARLHKVFMNTEMYVEGSKTLEFCKKTPDIITTKNINTLKKWYIPRIFEFGCRQGEFTQLLLEKLHFDEYICNDIYEYSLNICQKSIAKNAILKTCIFDMNELSSHKISLQKFNLIASNACLQWLDFSTTIPILIDMLEYNGILLLGTFGIENFKEIRSITGFGLQYLFLQQIEQELKRYGIIITLQEKKYELQFENALEVFRHLQKSGVNSLGEKNKDSGITATAQDSALQCSYECKMKNVVANPNYIKKSWLQDYEKRFSNKLTYHAIFILVRKK